MKYIIMKSKLCINLNIYLNFYILPHFPVALYYTWIKRFDAKGFHQEPNIKKSSINKSSTYFDNCCKKSLHKLMQSII